jgi:hypothetical protein
MLLALERSFASARSKNSTSSQAAVFSRIFIATRLTTSRSRPRWARVCSSESRRSLIAGSSREGASAFFQHTRKVADHRPLPPACLTLRSTTRSRTRRSSSSRSRPTSSRRRWIRLADGSTPFSSSRLISSGRHHGRTSSFVDTFSLREFIAPTYHHASLTLFPIPATARRCPRVSRTTLTPT